jgi:hypothetical protein
VPVHGAGADPSALGDVKQLRMSPLLREQLLGGGEHAGAVTRRVGAQRRAGIAAVRRHWQTGSRTRIV